MPGPGSTPAATLYLVDGYALIYRAFFAMIARPLTTRRGENTSAAWGVTNFLLRLLERRVVSGRVVPASDLPPVQGDAREAHGGAAAGVRPVGRADRTARRGVQGPVDRRRRI